MRYHTFTDGEWTTPTRDGWYLKCCRCGVVHRLEFRLISRWRGKMIEFRAFRLKRRTKR